MKFKYLINHYIDLQPKAVGIEFIINVLEKEHKISRSTFMRDRNIQLQDETSIPTDRLEIYASLFGVAPDDLKNYAPKKIKPLIERKPSAIVQKVIKRAKLKK